MSWFPIQMNFHTGVTGDVTGKGVTGWLRTFNDNRDDFIIELSMPLLMVGFVAGTVDVFTGSGLSQMTWFSVTWGIIQAIAIDGLFFAVWSKVKNHNWDKSWFRGAILVIVGLLLAVVASLVNNILTYQEINHVANLAQTMNKLGIDASFFSYGRSILVVLISILVALVARGEGINVRELQAKIIESTATINRHVEEIAGLRTAAQTSAEEHRRLVEQSQSLQGQLQAVTGEKEMITKELFRLRDEVSRLRGTVEEYRTMSNRATVTPVTPENPVTVTGTSNRRTDKHKKVTGFVATDDGQTVTVQQDGKTVTATGSYRELIKDAMLQLVEENQEIKYPLIAEMTGVNLSTIKRYGPSLKDEVLAIASPQDKEGQNDAPLTSQ